jgi:hypothetical protein
MINPVFVVVAIIAFVLALILMVRTPMMAAAIVLTISGVSYVALVFGASVLFGGFLSDYVGFQSEHCVVRCAFWLGVTMAAAVRVCILSVMRVLQWMRGLN